MRLPLASILCSAALAGCLWDADKTVDTTFRGKWILVREGGEPTPMEGRALLDIGDGYFNYYEKWDSAFYPIVGYSFLENSTHTLNYDNLKRRGDTLDLKQENPPAVDKFVHPDGPVQLREGNPVSVGDHSIRMGSDSDSVYVDFTYHVVPPAPGSVRLYAWTSFWAPGGSCPNWKEAIPAVDGVFHKAYPARAAGCVPLNVDVDVGFERVGDDSAADRTFSLFYDFGQRFF